MPVTTVDIPEKLMEHINWLVRKGVTRHRKQVILSALELYQKLEAHRWIAPHYNIRGRRVVLIDAEGLKKLVSSLPEQRLMEAGRELGHALKNNFSIELEKDTEDRNNWGFVFDFLRDLGWGNFTLVEDKVHVTDGGLNFFFIYGCLEELLGTKLSMVTSNGGIAIFEVEKRRR